ncbi:MAG: hypothetical protein QOH47_2375 [Sphingomonadales bacterium]|jgi:hypothetical protein|nr:hypothetical protein [Sphingomonadales bacterium]
MTASRPFARADDRRRNYMRLADGAEPIRWRKGPAAPEHAAATIGAAFMAAGIDERPAVIIWEGTRNV